MHGPEDGWMGREPLHEYNVAAACGGFWGGPRDADGIPGLHDVGRDAARLCRPRL